MVYGDDNVGPYLKDVLKDVYTVNFYNHDDYALNIWGMNNTSKPDNLRGVGTRDTSFSCSPVVDDKGDTTYVFKCEKWERDGFFSCHQGQLHPENVENDRWCVFSFVTPTRSLAFGQLPMEGVVNKSLNLPEMQGYKDSHYFHSWQFRSDVTATYGVWREIRLAINGKGK